MSYDEMQQVWIEQPEQSMPQEAAREWIVKTRRSHLWKTVLVTLGAASGLFVVALKLIVILNDTRHTFANSAFDLSVGAGVCICAFFGLHQYVKERRELEALGKDLKLCLDALIRATRNEIRGLKVFMPLAYLGFLILIVLSKLQSIASGNEPPGNAWGGMAFAVCTFVVFGAFMHFRADQVLKPKLQSLEETRRSF